VPTIAVHCFPLVVDDKQLEGEQAKETHKRAINQIFDIKYILLHILCMKVTQSNGRFIIDNL
jgi:hypothetical protein